MFVRNAMNQFDKELFLSLCHAYDVELSNTAKEPMLIEGNDIRPITKEDIKDEFADLIKKQEVNTMKKQYVLSYEQGE